MAELESITEQLMDAITDVQSICCMQLDWSSETIKSSLCGRLFYLLGQLGYYVDIVGDHEIRLYRVDATFISVFFRTNPDFDGAQVYCVENRELKLYAIVDEEVLYINPVNFDLD